jgi:hypothetical protein
MEHPEQGRLGSPDILHGTHIILPISFAISTPLFSPSTRALYQRVVFWRLESKNQKHCIGGELEQAFPIECRSFAEDGGFLDARTWNRWLRIATYPMQLQG